MTRWRLDVLPRIPFHTLTQHPVLRSEETHRDHDQVGGEVLAAVLQLLHIPATRGRFGPFNTHGVDAFDITIVVRHELLGHDAVLARVLAQVRLHLAVAVVHPVDPRPLRPGVVLRALGRRLRQQLEVCDGLGAVTDRGSDAVVTRVTATNDNNVLVFRGNVGVVAELAIEQGLCVAVKELHGEVDTVEVTVGDG